MKYRITTDYDGKARKVYAKTCAFCGKIFWRPKHRLSMSKFCSAQCTHYGQQKRDTIKCDLCGKEFTRTRKHSLVSKSGLRFCSRLCKDKAQSIDHGLLNCGVLSSGISSYRNRAFRAYGKKCCVCGYDEYENMLDVHHKDRDRTNGKVHNLKVLCVWCHALQTRNVSPHAWAGKISLT